MSMPVLYVLGCAAPPVLHIRALIGSAIDRGWDACLFLTATADRWLAESRDELIELTGRPIRTDYKLPGQPDLFPPADAMLVAPTTSNTFNKWAAGISDTLVLGQITEAIGKGLPLVTLPCLNAAQAKHPAFKRSVDTLRDAGVQVLLDGDGYTPYGSGGAGVDFPWERGLERLALPEIDRG